MFLNQGITAANQITIFYNVNTFTRTNKISLIYLKKKVYDENDQTQQIAVIIVFGIILKIFSIAMNDLRKLRNNEHLWVF